MRALDHLTLKTKDGQQLKCRFNPKEITVAKSSEWHATPAKGAKKAPTPEFVGANQRTLQMELFFDGWDSGAGDVTSDIEKLFTWTCPTDKSRRTPKPQPPIVVLHWGSVHYFEVYLKSVSAKYTMFSPHGAPIRATVTVACEETPMSASGQNPTSGGVAGRRSHLLTAGESLASVAFAEYRSAALWRALADVNGIDDPTRVKPGTTLMIPPLSAMQALGVDAGVAVGVGS